MNKIIIYFIIIFYPISISSCVQEYYLQFVSSLPQYTIYTVDISFYTLSSTETDNTPTIGALNTKLKIGRDVAVSRNLRFLLGKKVYIEGYGVRTVKDLMNPRYKNRVDILVGSKNLAKKLGIKRNKQLIIIN